MAEGTDKGGRGTRTAPPPGAAPMPAPDAAALLRRNAADPSISVRPAMRFEDRVWTHGEYVAESARWARWISTLARDEGRSTHVGVLLDNVPEYLFALGGAALAHASVVGLNHTRVGDALLRDLTHTDCDVIVTEPRHLPALAELDLAVPVVVSHRWDERGELAGSVDLGSVDLDEAIAGASGATALDATADGDPRVDPDALWALIFTSGTSGAPKAVICTQRRLLVTGNRMTMLLDLGPDDVGYVCMPLFHSNALMVGWAPSLVAGASVGLARRFSASRWLDDVRRYGATWFNYTGKPLSYLVATPERPDDADNPVKIAFGNEGSDQVIEAFGRRFDVEVLDAFGSTEGAIGVNRDGELRPGAAGVAGDTIQVVDEHGRFCPPARLDDEGRLLNPDECVGEIVNTAGSGPFEGYYNNDEATGKATRDGWYWSGDLGYLDEDRYLYFAGRTADWIRVDGENFPAEPILSAVASHPDVVVGAVYGVPDVQAGDQVMAAIVLREGAAFDGAAFAEFVDGLSGVGPKWRPRYVRVSTGLPTTGTNKVITRTLVHQKYRRDRIGADEMWVRDRGADAYRRFTAADEAELHGALVDAGRERFWDL
ncbi:MAG TPA: AMP-binding protein [Microthrixaceae bacterium]|nr:AMP-binding protein [Microthrixaceae bacterium]